MLNVFGVRENASAPAEAGVAAQMNIHTQILSANSFSASKQWPLTPNIVVANMFFSTIV